MLKPAFFWNKQFMPMNYLTHRSGANADTTFARVTPSHVNAAKLAAGVEKVMAVPMGANFCIFSGDADFFARADAPAAIPAADVTDGSAPELNPSQWDVSNVSALHLIADEDAMVTLSFYR